MKINHTIKRTVAVTMLATGITLMAGNTSAEAASKKPTTMTVTNAKNGKMTLYKGNTKNLKVTVGPKAVDAKFKKVTYSSSNSKVVKVNANGKLTAVKKGTAKITVTSKTNKKLKKTVTVTVKNPSVSVSTTKKTASVKVGATTKLSYTVKANGTSNKGVTFTSSNKSVATVSTSGKVTGKKAGTATITIASKYDKSKKVSVKVTVKKASTKANVSISVQGKDTYTQRGNTLTLVKDNSLKKEKNKFKYKVSASNGASTDVIFTSSNKNVATVDAKGIVTGHRIGTTTITIKSKTDNSVKASFTLKVLYASGDYSAYVDGWEDPDWWDVYPGAVTKPGAEVHFFVTNYTLYGMTKGDEIELVQVNSKKEVVQGNAHVLYYYIDLSPRAKQIDNIYDKIRLKSDDKDIAKVNKNKITVVNTGDYAVIRATCDKDLVYLNKSFIFITFK